MARVYVSSTIVDLKQERQAVMDWLRAARHQAVDSYLPDSTHLEFRRAGQSGIPRIVLLRTSIPDVSVSDMENPQRAGARWYGFRQPGRT
jgi:uncharacterized protein DUF4062